MYNTCLIFIHFLIFNVYEVGGNTDRNFFKNELVINFTTELKNLVRGFAVNQKNGGKNGETVFGTPGIGGRYKGFYSGGNQWGKMGENGEFILWEIG